jgi:hypothetical protein
MLFRCPEGAGNGRDSWSTPRELSIPCQFEADSESVCALFGLAALTALRSLGRSFACALCAVRRCSSISFRASAESRERMARNISRCISADFTQVGRQFHGFTAILVHRRRDRLHQSGKNRIAGCLRENAVKLHVVDQKIAGLVYRQRRSRQPLQRERSRDALPCRALRPERQDCLSIIMRVSNICQGWKAVQCAHQARRRTCRVRPDRP